MIVRARLQSYSLPLRDPWPSAEGDLTERRGWILALEDDQGRMGLGEAAPFPGFGLETYASAGAGLRLALKHIVGLDADGYDDAIRNLPALAPVAATPTARSAIDTALYDLMTQSMQVPLAYRFNPIGLGIHARVSSGKLDNDPDQRAEARRIFDAHGPVVDVRVNATIPRVTPERVAEMGAGAAAAGFGTLKLKVGGAPLEEDAARLRALRDTVGSAVRIRVDANQAWAPDEAIPALRALEAFDLEYVEQPVAAKDIDGLARVRRESGVKIAADESLSLAIQPSIIKTFQDLHKLSTAADVFIVKPEALGGLGVASMVKNHVDGSLPIVVTSLLETVVGRTAAVHFAASLGRTEYAHGVATGDAFTKDLAEGPYQMGGAVNVPDAPGLGVRLPESFWDGAHVVEGE